MDQYFLQLLAKGTNRKQNTSILKFIDKQQYNTLKEIACNILNEVIPLNSNQFNSLRRHKTFIRNLGKGKASKTQLVKNYLVVSQIIQIALDHELHAKVSSSTPRRVGKGKRQKLQGYKTSSDSESSTESTESTESLSSEKSAESSTEKSAESSSEFSEKSTEENGETEWEID